MNAKSAEELAVLLVKSELVHRDRYKSWRTGRSGLECKLASELADALVEDGLITRWQADKLLLGQWKGFQLDNYVITGLVLRGEQVSQFSAVDTESGKHVVLEVWSPSSGLRSDGVLRYTVGKESW